MKGDGSPNHSMKSPVMQKQPYQTLCEDKTAMFESVIPTSITNYCSREGKTSVLGRGNVTKSWWCDKAWSVSGNGEEPMVAGALAV